MKLVSLELRTMYCTSRHHCFAAAAHCIRNTDTEIQNTEKESVREIT